MRRIVIRGCGNIKLVKYVEEATLRAPDGSVKICVIEHRLDPLTGLWVRINVERALRERRVNEEEVVKHVQALAERTRGSCPFCKHSIDTATPRFYTLPRHVIVRDRVVLVPNLFPFAKFHAVAVLNPERHYVNPEELMDTLPDLLLAAQDFFEEVTRVDSSQVFHYVNMNFLYPAGASAVHPHAQIFTSHRPTHIHRLLLRRSRQYFRTTGRCLILDYVETEHSQQCRVILATQVLTVFAPFAPLANYEINIVIRDRASLQELTFSEIKHLARVLGLVLAALQHAYTQYSFNLAIYSVCPGSIYAEYSRVLIKIACRKEPVPNYVNDVGFMELLHQEPVLVTCPEEYARRLRGYLLGVI